MYEASTIEFFGLTSVDILFANLTYEDYDPHFEFHVRYHHATLYCSLISELYLP